MAKHSMAPCSRCSHPLTNHVGPDKCYRCAGYTAESYVKPVLCIRPEGREEHGKETTRKDSGPE